LPRYVIKKEDRCPVCRYPKTYIFSYEEEKVKTGKGKIEKFSTGKTIREWICKRCGNR